jgi:hypothetical protein
MITHGNLLIFLKACLHLESKPQHQGLDSNSSLPFYHRTDTAIVVKHRTRCLRLEEAKPSTPAAGQCWQPHQVKTNRKQGVLVLFCNPSSQVWGQPRLYSKTLSQKIKQKQHRDLSYHGTQQGYHWSEQSQGEEAEVGGVGGSNSEERESPHPLPISFFSENLFPPSKRKPKWNFSQSRGLFIAGQKTRQEKTLPLPSSHPQGIEEREPGRHQHGPQLRCMSPNPRKAGPCPRVPFQWPQTRCLWHKGESSSWGPGRQLSLQMNLWWKSIRCNIPGMDQIAKDLNSLGNGWKGG